MIRHFGGASQNSPNSFPLYLAYYPYGELKGDTISPLFPKIDGETIHFRIQMYQKMLL